MKIVVVDKTTSIYCKDNVIYITKGNKHNWITQIKVNGNFKINDNNEIEVDDYTDVEFIAESIMQMGNKTVLQHDGKPIAEIHHSISQPISYICKKFSLFKLYGAKVSKSKSRYDVEIVENFDKLKQIVRQLQAHDLEALILCPFCLTPNDCIEFTKYYNVSPIISDGEIKFIPTLILEDKPLMFGCKSCKMYFDHDLELDLYNLIVVVDKTNKKIYVTKAFHDVISGYKHTKDELIAIVEKALAEGGSNDSKT